jgi:hypothetical protein
VGKHCPNRPIVFIGHCFGGIIIEKALASSKQRSHSIVDHTVGVVFIATPHRGTQTQSTAAIIADIAAKANLGQRSRLIDSLAPHEDFLKDIVFQFSRLANEIRIPICCFYEQRRTDVASILRKNISLIPHMNVRSTGSHFYAQTTR